MKKALLITYFFPPAGGIDVMTALNYAKYLKNYGWMPYVLTIKLIKEIPDDVKIYETLPCDSSMYLLLKSENTNLVDEGVYIKSGRENNINLFISNSRLKYFVRMLYETFKRAMIPDPHIGWIITAVPRALSITKRENINAIFTTSPYHSVHLIGYFIKKLTNLPWVVDFRDGWIGAPEYRPDNRIRLKMENFLESVVVKNADEITCATPGILEEFIKLHSDIDKEKFSVITNGYDQEKYEKNKKYIGDERYASEDKLTITYTGTLGKKWPPDFFLKALNALMIEHPEIKNEIEILFVGKFPEEKTDLINKFNFRDIVKLKGFVSHDESIRYQLNADILLMINFPIQGGKTLFTGKIFEYIAAKRPILATIQECNASELIRSENLGIVVPPDDVDAIKNAIYDMYKKYKNDHLKIAGKMDMIKRFDRRELTRQLAEVFDEIFNGHKKK
jgi:glycosyltransferase involved in cell wall biosynthesis